MTPMALALSLALAAEQAPRTRFNFEPFVLGSAGAVGVVVGAVLVGVAESTYTSLAAIPLTPASVTEERRRIEEAYRLTTQGKAETGLAISLLCLGGTLLVGSIVWLLVEGFDAPLASMPLIPRELALF